MTNHSCKRWMSSYYFNFSWAFNVFSHWILVILFGIQCLFFTLICSSLVTYDVKHVFLGLIDMYIVLSEESIQMYYLSSVSIHFLIIEFFILLYIVLMDSSSDMCTENIIPKSRLFSQYLSQSNNFKFSEVQVIKFINMMLYPS